jgi:serine/threonine-protein kinase ULK/ATG1
MQGVRNEVKLMSLCLYHPNIVRIYSSFRQQDFFYIVMEYAGHRSLDDVALPITESIQAAGMVLQITLALRHLQRLKIVHRDIKLANILISPKGLLKLADFGIGRQIENNANSMVGTPCYLAPEIIRK